MADPVQMDAERFVALLVALGVGFLIGLQREQTASGERQPERTTPGGVRTYPLVALSGALASLLAPRFGVWAAVLGFLWVLIPLALAYADDLRRERDRGITSEIAFLLTYLLGCLSTADGVAGSLKERLLLCAGTAVAVTALLSYKDPLHALASRISRDDLYATVKFGVLALVALPLLPDKGYGPYQALNPSKIGLFVVLVAGLSFLGYVAVRWLGPGKGLGVTGLIGGLLSSTAIALTFSARAKTEPKAASACALGIILASAIMGLRVIGVVGFTNPSLIRLIAAPVGALSLAGFVAGGILYLKSRNGGLEAEGVRFSNPFELASAFKFGVLFTIILLVVKAATQHWGARGSYAAALLAGTADVDAITISLSRTPAAELAPQNAAIGIFLACAANTLVKAGIAAVVGGWSFAWRVVVALAGMVGAGIAGSWAAGLRP
jgi:uncharacterized membrane protein (DUF4010 family)